MNRKGGRCLGALLLLVASMVLAACAGQDGACVGAGPSGCILAECYQNESKDECDAVNQRQTNGCTWVFNSGKTCQEMGYPNRCGTGVYCR
jgi:hypothetical protein